MHNWHDIVGQEIGESVVGRDASALREAEWKAIDDQVIDVVRRTLFARQLLAENGCFDTDTIGGLEPTLETWARTDRAGSKRDMTGQPEDADRGDLSSSIDKVPIEHAESRIPWRELEVARQTGRLPEVRDTVGAGAKVALGEDDLYLNGDSDLGIDGILAPTNGQSFAGSDWGTSGNAFSDVNTALEKLELKDIEDPQRYLLVHPSDGKQLRDLTSNDNAEKDLILESDLVRDVISTNAIGSAGTAHVGVLQPQYVTAYLGVDVRTDEYTVQGRDVGLTTWLAATIRVHEPNAFVKITGV